MADFELDSDNLKELFKDVAQAVSKTQNQLDLIKHPSDDRGVPSVVYFIPRTVFELKAALEVQKGKLRLVARKRRSETDTHSLRFSLITVPDPPGPSTQEVSPISLLLPDFLLPVEQENRICAELSARLEAALPGAYESALPRGGRIKNEAVRREGAEIRKNRECGNKTSERGIVVFQISFEPASYLVVRVTGSDVKKDGLCLYKPAAQPPLRIYSLERDGIDEILYEPFDILINVIRGWLAGSPPRRSEQNLDADLQIGLRFLKEFSRNLVEGVVEGLSVISQSSLTQSQDPFLPSHYSLEGVEGALSYSVDDATRGSSADDDDLPKLIESRAIVRVRHPASAPQLEVEVVSPEFVLSGAALGSFLDTAVDHAEDIADKFAEDDNPREPYLDSLLNPYARRDVVVLLSYRDKPPKKEFLVVWPGQHAKRAQDFIFTCKLMDSDGDADGGGAFKRKIEDILVIRRMSDEQGGTTVHISDTLLTREQYRAFHDFFHAVRVWRTRIRIDGEES